MALFETDRVRFGEDKDGVEVLDDTSEWVDVRELSVPHLREADRKGTEEMVALMGLLPEAIVNKQMEQQRTAIEERITRYEGFDPELMLKYGVTGWSFDEECTPENVVSLLGARKGELVARRIFELSVLQAGEVGSSSMQSKQVESPKALPEPTDS